MLASFNAARIMCSVSAVLCGTVLAHAHTQHPKYKIDFHLWPSPVKCSTRKASACMRNSATPAVASLVKVLRVFRLVCELGESCVCAFVRHTVLGVHVSSIRESLLSH